MISSYSLHGRERRKEETRLSPDLTDLLFTEQTDHRNEENCCHIYYAIPHVFFLLFQITSTVDSTC